MKIVLSRKGFDSSFGGVPSPLLDGRPISLPIPTERRTLTAFGDLRDPVPQMVADLSGARLGPASKCHLDPDLDEGALPNRRPGWRGALGQVAAAQAHLANQRVGTGDVFLFCGLFRPVEQRQGRWRYAGPPIHAVFGWLQVGETVSHPGGGPLPGRDWLDRHPHAHEGWDHMNIIYLGTESLALPHGTDLPGFGVFRTAFRLTAPDAPSPSLWRVPEWLHADGGAGMTYHPPHRWLDAGKVRSAARGQEFVADTSSRPDAAAWLADVIGRHQ
jgi:putative DNA base modification enzyme with NMAD domain